MGQNCHRRKLKVIVKKGNFNNSILIKELVIYLQNWIFNSLVLKKELLLLFIINKFKILFVMGGKFWKKKKMI